MTNEYFEECFDSSISFETNEWTQDVFAGIPTCKGVLLFTDKAFRPLQLLISANIRRFIKNRIERSSQEELTRQADILDVASVVYYKKAWNDFRTRLFYNDVAKRCFPDTYKDWIDLPKTHFVQLDTNDQCPCFGITETPKFKNFNSLYLYGLFPSRKAADRYCHVLNIVHDLCRNPSLACSQKRQTCSYFQMHLCDGYCMGKVSRETYMKQVEKAIHYSSVDMSLDLIEELKSQMNHFGQSQEYEKAQKIKEKIELLESLDTAAYNWTDSLKSMDILHIDRSEKTEIESTRRKQQTYDIFRIAWNSIHAKENILGPDLLNTIDEIESETNDAQETSKSNVLEHLATVSWFLYRKNKNGLWMNGPAEKIKHTENYANQIFSVFPELLKDSKKNEDADNTTSSPM